jgi:hypothetical protein
MKKGDTESRKARIDELLLFLSSGLGIVFSVIQASVAGVSSVVLFAPLLLLGLVLPIYLGYIKGAVQDRSEERIRGWTYLIGGVLIYFTHIGLYMLREYYHVDPFDLLALVIQYSAGSFVFIIVIHYLKTLTGWILGVSEEEVGTGITMVSRITQFSAFMLAFGLESLVVSCIFSPSSATPSIFLPATISIGMVAWGVALFWDSGLWSVISSNIEVVRLRRTKISWLSYMKAVLIRLVPGGTVFVIGVLLSQSNPDLGLYLEGIGILLVFGAPIAYSLKSRYAVQVDFAKVERTPERRSKELLAAIRWIERIGYLGVDS